MIRLGRFLVWYRESEMGRFWMARCRCCGWRGLSSECSGFGPIGDTGDFEEGHCPVCTTDVDEEEWVETHWALWILRLITFWATREKIARMVADRRYAELCKRKFPDTRRFE